MNRNNEQIAMSVSRNSILANAALSAFKLFAGFSASSAAMLSDAVHSLSDVLSTVIVMVGVKLAGKDSDADHPYGHERFECVAALLLAGMLFATGIGIGYGGIGKIMGGSAVSLTIPGMLALVAAVVSIAVKEGMYWYTRAAAKRIKSGALMADAWHHRSDALSSVGSFVGILGARLGFPILDPLACVVICLFILKAAYDIFRDSVGKMTDKACDACVAEQLEADILSRAGVLRIDKLKTRMFGDRIYVDVEISADSSLSLEESHQIAHRVHDAIEESYPQVKHCMVHVNPLNEEKGDANSCGEIDVT